MTGAAVINLVRWHVQRELNFAVRPRRQIWLLFTSAVWFVGGTWGLPKLLASSDSGDQLLQATVIDALRRPFGLLLVPATAGFIGPAVAALSARSLASEHEIGTWAWHRLHATETGACAAKWAAAIAVGTAMLLAGALALAGVLARDNILALGPPSETFGLLAVCLALVGTWSALGLLVGAVVRSSSIALALTLFATVVIEPVARNAIPNSQLWILLPPAAVARASAGQAIWQSAGSLMLSAALLYVASVAVERWSDLV